MPMDYNALLDQYNADRLIPIIGNELLKVSTVDGSMTFEQHVIQRVTGKKIPESPIRTYSSLALEYPKLGSSRIIGIYNSLKAEDFERELLRKLTDLSRFKLFITTSYDRRLEELIINSESIAWNHENREALYLNLNNGKTKIVHLLGMISKGVAGDDIAFNEEDKLECLINLSSYNSLNKSSSMDKYSFLELLRGKTLLFIGNNFPDWFMRHLIRTLFNSPYRNNSGKAYIVNDKSADIGFQKYFFDKYQIELIHDNPIETFINNFFNIVKEGEEFVNRYENKKLFISYDRDDSEISKKIHNDIKYKGIDAWFDIDNLKIGAHEERIVERIYGQKTCMFICILSEALVNKVEAESYAKNIEWRAAEERYKANAYLEKTGNKFNPFVIVPIAIDNHNKYIEKLPEFIRANNILSVDDENLVDTIEKEIQKL